MKTSYCLVAGLLWSVLASSFSFQPCRTIGTTTSSRRSSSATLLGMNWFEKMLGNAFSNQNYPKENDRPKASARHILVKTQDAVGIVQEKLAAGGTASFASVARDFSTCPSGRQGGTLGRFGPGAMVKEFDAVIFDPNTPLGQVVGPVQTQFGYHFIVVDERTGM